MEFITYTQALELKKLGFDEPCWAWYNMPDEDVRYCFSEQRSPITNSHEEWSAQIWESKVENIGLPTFSQCFKWFREKYELHGYIEGMYPWCRYYINTHDDRWEGHKYDTYEECENALIDKLIEILKQK